MSQDYQLSKITRLKVSSFLQVAANGLGVGLAWSSTIYLGEAKDTKNKIF